MTTIQLNLYKSTCNDCLLWQFSDIDDGGSYRFRKFLGTLSFRIPDGVYILRSTRYKRFSLFDRQGRNLYPLHNKNNVMRPHLVEYDTHPLGVARGMLKLQSVAG